MGADDWQDTALNSKHIPHGRGKKSSRGKRKSKGGDVFNPNSALGSYELSGSALERLGGKLILEIHELTDTPGGIFGSMVLPDRFKAAVLLAGNLTVQRTIRKMNRKTLETRMMKTRTVSWNLRNRTDYITSELRLFRRIHSATRNSF